MKEKYVTITGMNHYYGLQPFKVGKKLKCIKEPSNSYDSEAIKVVILADHFGWNTTVFFKEKHCNNCLVKTVTQEDGTIQGSEDSFLMMYSLPQNIEYLICDFK